MRSKTSIKYQVPRAQDRELCNAVVISPADLRVLTVPDEFVRLCWLVAAGAFGKPSMAANYIPSLAQRVRNLSPLLAVRSKAG